MVCPFLLLLLLVSLTALAAPVPDDCTRDIWEQLPNGKLVQVRKNICGGGGVSGGGDQGVSKVGPPEPIGIQTPLSPADAAIVEAVPPFRQDVAVSPPAVAATTTTVAPATTVASPTTTAVAPTTTAMALTTNVPVKETSSGLSTGKLLLFKKLKLLALGALLLG